MHTSKHRLPVAAVLLLAFVFISGQVAAQIQKTFTPKTLYLTYGNMTVPTKSARLLDTLINGRLSYTGTMDLVISDESIGIISSMQQANGRASFTLTSADFDFRAKEVLNYSDVSFREISISSLDGASKDAARFTVAFSAPNLKQGTGGGTLVQASGKSKTVLASNFRFTINGLPSNRVSAIEKINFTGNTAFRITVAAADEETWREFFLSGKGTRLQGSIELLAPNMKDVVFRADFNDASFQSWEREYDSSSEKIQRFAVGVRARFAMLTTK
ncbi:MAG: hypothetical protein EOO09_13750 [Chitinophagaceae bacterium]|nr:MAG: hypothetical protein EOO09_13750 [Chitinophagaceae bacterium]